MVELETKVHPKIRNHRITQPNLNLGTFYDTELNSEGEGPSRGLLRDYESSDVPSFEALLHSLHN